MTQNILYLTKSEETSNGWQQILNEQGFQVLRASSDDQLMLFARSHPFLAALVHLDSDAGARERTVSVLGRLRQLPEGASVPIIGLMNGVIEAGELSAFVDAGLTGIFPQGLPTAFLLQHLAAIQQLQRLRAFEEAETNVRKLSAETRQKIHDLSQPLAALQGRLQVLNSKTPEDDPLKDRFKLLVSLVLEVGTHLRELQEMHRKYS